MNEWQQKEKERQQKLLNDLNSASAYKWQLVSRGSESMSIALTESDAPIVVRFDDYRKKYSFFLNNNLPYTRYYSIERATQKVILEGIKEPQQVGVLSAKKIADWITFLSAIYKELEKTSQEKVMAIDAYKEKIAPYNPHIRIESEYYKTFKGRIKRNGIELEFSIDNEGYIHEKMSIYYGVRGFDDFLAISDNKYQEKKG
jgi:hypothetical protein